MEYDIKKFLIACVTLLMIVFSCQNCAIALTRSDNDTQIKLHDLVIK